ncbi:uncharacterized protein ATNIH1004_009112 [Aspergillus tanneri]|uniref:Uncharacterized protein n=1 Tax=Aspergillus tanneri TaxID=1220188 RepID=A0A5M9MIW8_9EURO|nr:uncharacterized protein ATNIH1004_009112 [Aspergillus tanneri]KAA8644903.1 hypothetical protein ATNIH1004_009112 [Aspergillus tanneri]
MANRPHSSSITSPNREIKSSQKLVWISETLHATGNHDHPVCPEGAAGDRGHHVVDTMWSTSAITFNGRYIIRLVFDAQRGPELGELVEDVQEGVNYFEHLRAPEKGFSLFTLYT